MEINNSMSKMEIKKFYSNVEIFQKEYLDYTKRNVNVLGQVEDEDIIKLANTKFGYEENTGYFAVDMYTEIPEAILISVSDIIQKFVQICETHGISDMLEPEEKKFLSGAKCIDNIIKHKKKKQVSITDFLIPKFDMIVNRSNVGLSKNNELIIPIDSISFEMRADWVSMSEGFVADMKKTTKEVHYPNYQDYFANNDVIDTVIMMINIMNKYIID